MYVYKKKTNELFHIGTWMSKEEFELRIALDYVMQF